jgi:GT2 family glycosyltransferase
VPGAPIYRLATAGQFWRSLPRGVGVMRRGGDYMISYVNAWRVFFDAIRGQATEYPTLQDGLRMTQTATAAMESLQRRVIVPLPPVGVGANATAPHGAVAHSAVTTTGTTPPTFSIVVPTYNRPSHLHGLLQSLALQRFPREQFEVVVVDDGGMRPLDSVVAPFQEQLQIRLLRQANRGCAPARQFGIEAARGRFLAFTDDDCRPSPDWLSHLHACLLRHPGSAVIGPTINGLDHDLYAETTQLIVNWLTLANVDPEGRVDYGPTCNIAFPAKLFLEIGGLDKNWSIAGGEDRDLCARWFDAGLDLYFEPQAQVTHFHPLTRAQFLRQHFFYGRGARKFRRAKGAEQTGSRAFNRLGSYVRLMSLPVQQYDGSVALKIAANLVLAQLANAWGMAMEMLGRRLAAEEEEDVQVLAER